jgi:heme-degrading monooxygenase HmoA
MAMFVAMNRFRVIKTEAEAFEERWIGRDSQLHKVAGFVTFNLLRGPEREDHILYVSHTIWRSLSYFEAWTQSEAFRAAHASAGGAKPVTLGHPEFEGFEAVGGAERGEQAA